MYLLALLIPIVISLSLHPHASQKGLLYLLLLPVSDSPPHLSFTPYASCLSWFFPACLQLLYILFYILSYICSSSLLSPPSYSYLFLPSFLISLTSSLRLSPTRFRPHSPNGNFRRKPVNINKTPITYRQEKTHMMGSMERSFTDQSTLQEDERMALSFMDAHNCSTRSKQTTPPLSLHPRQSPAPSLSCCILHLTGHTQLIKKHFLRKCLKPQSW